MDRECSICGKRFLKQRRKIVKNELNTFPWYALKHNWKSTSYSSGIRHSNHTAEFVGPDYLSGGIGFGKMHIMQVCVCVCFWFHFASFPKKYERNKHLSTPSNIMNDEDDDDDDEDSSNNNNNFNSKALIVGRCEGGKERTEENHPLNFCVQPVPVADEGDCGCTVLGCGIVFPSSLKSSYIGSREEEVTIEKAQLKLQFIVYCSDLAAFYTKMENVHFHCTVAHRIGMVSEIRERRNSRGDGLEIAFWNQLNQNKQNKTNRTEVNGKTGKKRIWNDLREHTFS